MNCQLNINSNFVKNQPLLIQLTQNSSKSTQFVPREFLLHSALPRMPAYTRVYSTFHSIVRGMCVVTLLRVSTLLPSIIIIVAIICLHSSGWGFFSLLSGYTFANGVHVPMALFLLTTTGWEKFWSTFQKLLHPGARIELTPSGLENPLCRLSKPNSYR